MRKRVVKLLPLLFFGTLIFASEGGNSIWSPTVLLIGHVFNFVVFAFVLYKLLKKPIAEVMRNQRVELIKKLEEAEKKEKESEKKLKEIEERMAKLKDEVEAILKKTDEIANKEKEKILAKAKEEAEKIKKLADIEIQNKINAAKKELKNYMLDLASKNAEELIKSSITEKDIDGTIENYFKELEG